MWPTDWVELRELGRERMERYMAEAEQYRLARRAAESRPPQGEALRRASYGAGRALAGGVVPLVPLLTGRLRGAWQAVRHRGAVV